MTGPRSRILAVVGMRAEARLLARVGIESVVGGGNAERLASRLDRLLSPPLIPAKAGTQTRFGAVGGQQEGKQASLGPRFRGDEREFGEAWTGILSFGVAGGLSPKLQAGDLVIATEVVPEGKAPYPADPAWTARLLAALPHARAGAIAGVPAPVVTAADKAELFATTGALAADMESHIAAETAARHALPFAAVRAISDSAQVTLPQAALAGFGTDGRADVGAVLRALLSDPRQLPALIRTGVGAGSAFETLRRKADVIGGC